MICSELTTFAIESPTENLKSLMDAMGYKPGLNSNLSALQQGIQAVTENTAQALESLLNSMRYYLATQQADVRIIRDTLIERLGASVVAVLQNANNNPVLVELRLQTMLLTDIRDTLSSCVKSGHSQGSKGINPNRSLEIFSYKKSDCSRLYHRYSICILTQYASFILF